MAKRKTKVSYPVDVSPKSDAEWEAQMDAETLANAGAIRADKGRLGKAQKAAAVLAAEQQAKATTLKNVARSRKR